VATSSAPERVRERVERTCRVAVDARRLRAEVLDLLRPALAFDFHAFVLTDPATGVGADPLADVPMLDDLPRLIRLKYATAVNRWTGLGDPPVGLLRAGTGGRPERSPMWRELLRPAGISDVASMVLRDRYGCWAFLDLWRASPAAPFSPAEGNYLATLAPALTAGLRACQAATFADPPAGPAAGTTPGGPAVLLLAPDLTIRAQTAQTREYLRLLLPTAEGRSPVPAAAYNVAAQLLAVESGVDDSPPAARVHLGDGVWVALRAARIGAGPAADIAVSIERCPAAERLDLIARSCGLSARETRLLGILAGGADTGTAAARLNLSPLTVQDHLKSVFGKTGTRTRRDLLARVRG
jgi:DNA-binding CsgD family transcriptional regulator